MNEGVIVLPENEGTWNVKTVCGGFLGMCKKVEILCGVPKRRLETYVVAEEPNLSPKKGEAGIDDTRNFGTLEEAVSTAGREIFFVSAISALSYNSEDAKDLLNVDTYHYNTYWGDNREYGICIYKHKSEEKYRLTWRRHGRLRNGRKKISVEVDRNIPNLGGWKCVGMVHSHGEIVNGHSLESSCCRFSHTDILSSAGYSVRSPKYEGEKVEYRIVKTEPIKCYLVHVVEGVYSEYPSRIKNVANNKEYVGVIQSFDPKGIDSSIMKDFCVKCEENKNDGNALLKLVGEMYEAFLKNFKMLDMYGEVIGCLKELGVESIVLDVMLADQIIKEKSFDVYYRWFGAGRWRWFEVGRWGLVFGNQILCKPLPETNAVGTLDDSNNGIAFMVFDDYGTIPKHRVVANNYLD